MVPGQMVLSSSLQMASRYSRAEGPPWVKHKLRDDVPLLVGPQGGNTGLDPDMMTQDITVAPLPTPVTSAPTLATHTPSTHVDSTTPSAVQTSTAASPSPASPSPTPTPSSSVDSMSADPSPTPHPTNPNSDHNSLNNNSRLTNTLKVLVPLGSLMLIAIIINVLYRNRRKFTAHRKALAAAAAAKKDWHDPDSPLPTPTDEVPPGCSYVMPPSGRPAPPRSSRWSKYSNWKRAMLHPKTVPGPSYHSMTNELGSPDPSALGGMSRQQAFFFEVIHHPKDFPDDADQNETIQLYPANREIKHPTCLSPRVGSPPVPSARDLQKMMFEPVAPSPPIELSGSDCSSPELSGAENIRATRPHRAESAACQSSRRGRLPTLTEPPKGPRAPASRSSGSHPAFDDPCYPERRIGLNGGRQSYPLQGLLKPDSERNEAERVGHLREEHKPDWLGTPKSWRASPLLTDDVMRIPCPEVGTTRQAGAKPFGRATLDVPGSSRNPMTVPLIPSPSSPIPQPSARDDSTRTGPRLEPLKWRSPEPLSCELPTDFPTPDNGWEDRCDARKKWAKIRERNERLREMREIQYLEDQERRRRARGERFSDDGVLVFERKAKGDADDVKRAWYEERKRQAQKEMEGDMGVRQ